MFLLRKRRRVVPPLPPSSQAPDFLGLATAATRRKGEGEGAMAAGRGFTMPCSVAYKFLTNEFCSIKFIKFNYWVPDRKKKGSIIG